MQHSQSGVSLFTLTCVHITSVFVLNSMPIVGCTIICANQIVLYLALAEPDVLCLFASLCMCCTLGQPIIILAHCYTGLFIKLTPKGVVFSFLFFLCAALHSHATVLQTRSGLHALLFVSDVALGAGSFGNHGSLPDKS